jgi:hypothetical protein
MSSETIVVLILVWALFVLLIGKLLWSLRSKRRRRRDE